MKTTTGGYEIFFGLVIEEGEEGKNHKIVDCAKPGQVPLIGITIRKIPECQEYFEVRDEDGCLCPCKKGYGLWKFLGSKETTVTTLDEKEGIGYEFILSFQKNGPYTELKVSRSRLFASKCVTVEQLTQSLIQAAETYRKRKAPLDNEAIQKLITKFNAPLQASGKLDSTNNGKKGTQNKEGYFADVYREAKNDPSSIF